MMILSRMWYLVLALLLGAAVYVVMLAVGQYNRRNQVAMEETLKADSQVVSWAMQVDARRRLDVLLLAAVDPTIAKSLRAVNGKELPVAQSAKDDGQKALKAFNDKLPPEYKADALFLVDRDGRLVSESGYDTINGYPEFELGGYPAVFDAIHGFLRDDTWVWGGKIARVVTRPVEDEVGQPPLGAVVALRWVDAAFAKDMGKRTRTNIAFFALDTRVASAATTDGIDDQTLEGLGNDLKAVDNDKGWKESGRTDVRPLDGDKGGVLYVKLPGDTWELGGGFAVARPKVAISSPTGFISGADDTDKKNVKLWLVAVIALGAILFGMLFSYLEHTMPLKAMAREGDALKVGKTDALQLPKLRGKYRAIGNDINTGIQRIIEKGGGAGRKPADLESILGPVPAQPSMSAFSFPMNDPSQPPQTSPNMGGAFNQPAQAASQSGANNRFPGQVGAPPAAPSRPGLPPPGAPRPGTPGPGVPMAGPGGMPHQNAPPFAANIQGNERTMAMAGAPPTHGGGPAFNPGNPQINQGGASHSATVAASPGAQKMGMQATVPAPFPPPQPGAPPKLAKGDEDEQTMVAQPSADLIAATGGHNTATDPAAEWHQVYEEFIRTKRDCGEPTDGLTFEKFQQTLKKNRDALMQRHGCKRVKFSVYVKEGRASLKATPVRD